MMELLSPAGGWEAMVAAVQNGADAVYMGFGGLNARRSARNFTDEEFREAVAYCHLRGVKVYLTLNTLVTDRELPAAAEALKKASDMGVDAILIQDWGIWRLAREIAPDVPLHASTQMSLHTLGGACRAAELGLERVVLARELSRRDIHTITRGCPAEIEVFGHGALCMCYSGQCEMSAVIGGRSGNRGACAQPCRLPYGVNEKAAGGHPLSLKDANLADYVQELEQMGVACLKLEGRMKRPEYVAVITGIYRRLLDEKRGPSREESRQLEAAFSRSGFTDNIGGYGCGPTAMAIVVSSLTDDMVDPVEMAKWSYDNGYWCKSSGSYHALIPAAAEEWGLPVSGCTTSEPQRILDALADGKLVVAIMSEGHFTSSGHFIVLRGVKDGQIMVADPASYKRSGQLWDLSIILNEASRRAAAGGPFWIIG